MLHSSVRSLFNRQPSLFCYTTTDKLDIGVLVVFVLVVCGYEFSTNRSVWV